MSSLLRLFDPLRQAATAFFRHELTLRRDEHGLRLVLELSGAERCRKRPAESARDEATQKEAAELALMLEQLRALLSGAARDEAHAARPGGFVEQALAKKGLRALRKLPLDVLQRALVQFEGLVTNWSPVGLANLRSKMAVAIIDREHMDPDAEADAYRTAAVLDTDPDELPLDGSQSSSDDDALAAAYAALGEAGPSAVEMQPELGSPSARAVAQALPSPAVDKDPIKLREFQH